MKFVKKIAPVLLLFVLMSSCKKADRKTCWQLVDNLGVPLNVVCNKSENQMNDEYGGRYFFYRSSDKLYCWKLTRQPNTETYIRDQPQAMINIFFGGYTAVTVNCNSFCNWTIHYKSQSKITGLFTPTTVRNQTIFNVQDTCSKLFVGRVVTVSQTIDSIHTAEFKGTF